MVPILSDFTGPRNGQETATSRPCVTCAVLTTAIRPKKIRKPFGLATCRPGVLHKPAQQFRADNSEPPKQCICRLLVHPMPEFDPVD